MTTSAGQLLDAAAASTRTTMILGIEGMASPRVEHAIEMSLSRLPGMRASANYSSRKLRIEFDRTQCQLAEIVRRLDALGLRLRNEVTAKPQAVKPDWKRTIAAKAAEYHKLILATLGAILLIGAVIVRTQDGPPVLRWTFVVLSFIIAGWYTANDTFTVLLQLKFDIDVLMFAAAFGAAALGKPEEGAFLLVLFAFGGAGEELAMDRARRAIEALAKLAPDVATLRETDGREKLVKVEELRRDDLIVVKPFDRMPADGVVEEGRSAVDQAPITGESIPVEKFAGQIVFAGTINGEGLLIVRVTKLAGESTLAKIVTMVNEAQTTKSPTQMFTDKVERYYVPIVLIATAVLIVAPPLLGLHHRREASMGLWAGWFYNAMTFLTAASPCALAIGTPAAVLSGIAKAARIGVLVKGGVHLENLGRVTAIAFDKTGTLTHGRPEVTDIIPLNGMSEPDLLALAAAVEASSTHPIAAAIVNAARARGLNIATATDVQQIAGTGVHARVNEKSYAAGRETMFDRSTNPKVDAVIEPLARAGKSIVVLGEENRPIGVIALADQLRGNARESLARLRSLGIEHTVMLTGDRADVAKHIADQAGVDELAADLLPGDKLGRITDLLKKYAAVAMIGDGANDAPALAVATVGIAMGGAGTDVALETADVALMADDLSKLPQAIALSRFSRKIIKQNLTIALGVISILAPLSAMGFTNLWIAVMFHEGSTIVVVLNSLRLLMWHDRK